ncbi:MAG: hydrogenase small subunit [Xanthomonadaceae bacterium]|nr:hydrogenase small subunit [Xanthomonadaceae bacterium]MDE2244962.1 hydrogenase small subunit [Xanthomonadaceae bacterium]
MNTQRDPTVLESFQQQGLSRRAFLKFCAATASLLALPAARAAELAEKLAGMTRPTVIYLSFQECTGCLESLTRSFQPTLESLIFNTISLAYNDTLQAAAGEAAEAAREDAMRKAWGKYVLIVDGAIPRPEDGAYCVIGGRSALDLLRHAAEGAAAVVAVGTCAAFGGIPYAAPNPTGAASVQDLVGDRPVINISGCPPIPEVITGTIVYFLGFGVPELDAQRRPTMFYGTTIHDRCYRRPFYDKGLFARSFDDEGARNGWCLYELGCKGPVTYNSCATMKWNDGTSFPIQSGHGCLGCSEPNFWDGGGFYRPLSSGLWHGGIGEGLGVAAVAGVAIGGAAAVAARQRQKRITEAGKKPPEAP